MPFSKRPTLASVSSLPSPKAFPSSIWPASCASSKRKTAGSSVPTVRELSHRASAKLASCLATSTSPAPSASSAAAAPLLTRPSGNCRILDSDNLLVSASAAIRSSARRNRFAETLPGRSADRGDFADRRNRRHGGGEGGGVHPTARYQAGGGVCGRADSAAGQAYGARWRHHQRRQRHGQRQECCLPRCWYRRG